MHAKWIFALLIHFSLATVACAASSPLLWYGFHPLASLIGGISVLETSHSRAYFGTDGGVFSYHNQDDSVTAGLLGLYLGMEKQLSQPGCLLQTGLALLHVDNTKLHGQHAVGDEPETSTSYHYRYRLHAQQLLLVAKLLKTYRQIYHPYVAAGIGASFNHLSHFNATADETGSINLTPVFSANTHSAFTYRLGFGVDTNLSERLRLGIGYQFTDLGRARFANGRVIINQYSFPSPFNLAIDHNYSNQFFAEISYLA